MRTLIKNIKELVQVETGQSKQWIVCRERGVLLQNDVDFMS